MTYGTFTVEEAEVLASRFIERLKMCRAVGCVNACWEQTQTQAAISIKVVMFNTTVSFIRIVTGEAKQWFIEYPNPFTQLKVCKSLPTSPFRDQTMFEEVYTIYHHFFFGSCLLKNKEASAPLARLDHLEGLINDLIRIKEM